jgi:hypothetical protein
MADQATQAEPNEYARVRPRDIVYQNTDVEEL